MNRIRIETRSKKGMRVDVDTTSLLELLRSTWPDLPMDAHPIDYGRLRLDADELRKTLEAFRDGEGTGEFRILNCTCGIPECSGIGAVTVRRDGAVVRWTIRPTASELTTVEWAFDWAQYEREVAKLSRRQ